MEALELSSDAAACAAWCRHHPDSEVTLYRAWAMQDTSEHQQEVRQIWTEAIEEEEDEAKRRVEVRRIWAAAMQVEQAALESDAWNQADSQSFDESISCRRILERIDTDEQERQLWEEVMQTPDNLCISPLNSRWTLPTEQRQRPSRKHKRVDCASNLQELTSCVEEAQNGWPRLLGSDGSPGRERAACSESKHGLALPLQKPSSQLGLIHCVGFRKAPLLYSWLGSTS
eukprot:TRINITY_DN26410_c0_g1_i1.p1 TRINITY_DN26410_c0_g1~~TRINITY_DN26410_c0_g1_i1.p1  ORF type:complete len:244 (-),score=54.86 TRINITY_DN26410_c0_g1_i1:153-839(-)